MKLYDVPIARLSRAPARIAWRVAVAAALLLVLGTVALAVLGVRGPLVAVNFFGSFSLMVLSAVVGLASQPRSSIGRAHRGVRGDLSVATGGILVRTGDRERRDRVVTGVREEVAASHQVVLELLSGDALVVQTESAEAGERLLEDAGVSAAQRAVRLRISPVQNVALRAILASFALALLLVGVPSTLGFLASLGALLGQHPHRHDATFFEVFGALSAFTWVCGFFVLRALAATELTIGRDGVSVHRLRSTFLPFEDLRLRRAGARLGLRSGERTARFAAPGADEAARIQARVEQAREEFVARERRYSEVVSRNGRSLAEWRRDLQGLLSAPTDYRAKVSADELSAIVADPTAAPDQRLGAAVALSALSDDAPERARVRVAIDTTADPRLRVALERAAEGELDDHLLAPELVEPDLVERRRSR